MASRWERQAGPDDGEAARGVRGRLYQAAGTPARDAPAQTLLSRRSTLHPHLRCRASGVTSTPCATSCMRRSAGSRQRRRCSLRSIGWRRCSARRWVRDLIDGASELMRVVAHQWPERYRPLARRHARARGLRAERRGRERAPGHRRARCLFRPRPRRLARGGAGTRVCRHRRASLVAAGRVMGVATFYFREASGGSHDARDAPAPWSPTCWPPRPIRRRVVMNCAA